MERPSATRARRARRRGEGGFTLIELMTVIGIMGVLVAIALPNYKGAIIQSKEAVLKEDLTRLRGLLDQYQADRGNFPESLDDLVKDGYLRQVPVDPMTGSRDWVTELDEADPSEPSKSPGIRDVKSASSMMSLSGTSYSEW